MLFKNAGVKRHARRGLDWGLGLSGGKINWFAPGNNCLSRPRWIAFRLMKAAAAVSLTSNSSNSRPAANCTLWLPSSSVRHIQHFKPKWPYIGLEISLQVNHLKTCVEHCLLSKHRSITISYRYQQIGTGGNKVYSKAIRRDCGSRLADNRCNINM